MGAHDPAAGVFAGGFVKVFLFEAEAGEDFFGFGFELVAVEGGELILCFAEFFGAEVSGFFAFADGAEEADHFWGDAHGDFDDGFIGRFSGFLGEVAGDGVFITVDGAFVWLVFIEDHAEECRFAGAVGADEGDALAPVDGHFCLAEEGSAAEGFGQILDG